MHGENQTTTNRINWRKVAPTCATVAGVAFVILYFTPVWALLTTPSGRDIPRTAPNEDNRVYNPFGFSIVSPPHWRTRVLIWDHQATPLPAGISMYPDGPIPRRYSASMGVSMDDTPPGDLAEYSAVTFQGKPAFERRSSRPDRGFENPGQFSYTLAFERENRWYQIGFHLFTDTEQLPPEIQAYVDTFRIHNRPERRVDGKQ